MILEYLREYLHIPPEIVPLTHRKTSKPQREGGGLRPRDDGGAYRPPRREGGGDGEYRRRDDGRGERPRFGGGFGRGRVPE